MKKIVCLICVIALMLSSVNIVSAKTWSSYFGLNKGWYEGTKGKLTTNTSKCWTAKIQSIGWGGCWGGQVFQKNVSIVKGKKYTIKFSIKSTKMDKWVYLKIGDAKGKQINYAKWIDCKIGKTVKVKKSFTAKYDGNSVYFGFGGDFHDRDGVKTDEDVKSRYKYAPNKKLDARLPSDYSADHPTTIKVSGYSFKCTGVKFESPKMNQGFLLMDKGEKTVLKLAGAKGKVKWTASNKKLIKIKKLTKNKIAVKAKKTGNTTIIAKYKKKKYKCRIAIF